MIGHQLVVAAGESRSSPSLCREIWFQPFIVDVRFVVDRFDEVRSFAGPGLRYRPQIVEILFPTDILDNKEREGPATMRLRTSWCVCSSGLVAMECR